jgi:hypothetical protein
MPWWHVDDEPFGLSLNHPLKRSRHFLVVPAMNEVGPDILDVLHEVILSNFLCFGTPSFGN